MWNLIDSTFFFVKKFGSFKKNAYLCSEKIIQAHRKQKKP